MHTAERITHFQESIFREMGQLARERQAVDLSQGSPDFDTPLAVKEAAVQAILDGNNQYSPTWGHPQLCQRLAERYASGLDWPVNPVDHVTVTCGVTEGINATMLAMLNPGDELVIFEPAHVNYLPSAVFAGAKPVVVPLDPPSYRIDPERVARAITPRTRMLVLNSPHNPTGRVFDAEELAGIVDLVHRHDLVLVSDEIYDHILYDGRQHVSPGSMELLRERTITLGGLGKTFAMTGWRLGYVIAPAHLMRPVRAVHDFLTVCAPTPLQIAAAAGLDLPQSYYDEMLADYHRRRDVLMGILEELDFLPLRPEGAYYVLADYTAMPIPQAGWDSLRFATWMVKEIGVAVIPGAAFLSTPGQDLRSVRFSFSKRVETLEAAGKRMGRMRV